MPTPFYHLWIAQDLLEYSELTQSIRHFLKRQRGAFLFGNTAPDVQTLAGQSRSATHFFNYPFPPDHPSPTQVLLSTYPELGRPERMPEAQAAFLAGYMAHLHADWLWVRQIFHPSFGAGASWGEVPRRIHMHNVLRAYLDRHILPLLAQDPGVCLDRAEPHQWLPFVEDRFLRQWRDFLASQLRPQAAVQTVEVFAARQGVPVDSFYDLLDSEDRMQQEVFVHLSRQQIEAYRLQLLEESSQLISLYLKQLVQVVYRSGSWGVAIS